MGLVSEAAVFAAVAVTLFAGHQVADHVFGQTDRQARRKAEPGWSGWRHNQAHVAAYHVVLGAFFAAVVVALALPVSGRGMAAGLVFSAVTHAVIDRRWPVRWLLRHTGSGPYADTAEGMYQADQALHYGCLWIAAVLVVIL